MKALDYKIITQPGDLLQLEGAVRQALREGWQPYGQPFINRIEGGNTEFCQALVKYSEQDG